MVESSPTSHALVVGEIEGRRRRLGHLLMLHGWMVRWDTELAIAILRVKREPTHLVLFDWDPTKEAALDDIRRMRDETLVPLVVASHRATEDEAARAIELGADDFICEPLHRRLFLARCAAARGRHDARRATDDLNPVTSPPNSATVIGFDPHRRESLKQRSLGPLAIDATARTIAVEGRPIPLTPSEFSILLRLARTPGVPISDRELVTETLHEAFRPDSSIARFHIHRLRKKLGRYDYLIESVRPRGYRLSVERAPAGRTA